MNIVEIRIKNYKSVEAEQHFPIPGKMTLVGPNNSGKTNLLKAVRILFTGYQNTYRYARETDLTFGVGRQRTSITATFDGDPTSEADQEIYKDIDELHQLLGTTRSGSQLSLNLYFTETDTPVYSFFPNEKRPKPGPQNAQFSRIHISLVNKLLGVFSLHYVPSAKSVDQIYDELLIPFLRRKVSKVMEPHIAEIEASLTEAATALNDELSAAGLTDFKASFSLPSESIEELVSGFDFIIADPQKTAIHEKGMGIQTTALLAAFRWITKQEANDGRRVMWLLEEPESYLHPHLAASCNSILENLAKDSIVLKTTHSMAFVPQDPSYVRGTSLNGGNRTEVRAFGSYIEAVGAIRHALGVKFGDYYNLAKYNVLVEGKSDREIFQWMLSKIPQTSKQWECLREARFEDFGGVKHLSGFLRATYEFVRDERACIAVFDGDEAGEKERKDLQGYLGNKNIPFQPNLHFVSVRKGFAIEGLFPDEWITDIYEEHPGWFESYSVDVDGALEPFRVKDSKKVDLQAKLMAKADGCVDLSWASKFLRVGDTLDTALGKLSKQLENIQP